MSSLSFLGNETSYLRIPNTNAFDFGTGDFTIEWYQYQTDSNSYTRIFQIGNYTGGTLNIGVSIEGGVFYFWQNMSPILITTLNSSDYKNKWVHFAICRTSGVRTVYMNGTSISSLSDTVDYNGNVDLVIGNESSVSTDAAFGGYLTYFSWVKGTAVYTANFTVSNTYPSIIGNTVLMLSANGGTPNFAGTLGGTVVNNSVTAFSSVPTGFGSQPQNVVCFREGAQITCLVSGREALVPIESMRKGMLVKTHLHGYVPVELIKSTKIYNPADDVRSNDRLYKLSPSQYPELIAPLYLTGCHSILVNYLSEEENEETAHLLGKVFITDDKYRLMARIDKRAKPYRKAGIYTIWHFSLENDDYYTNYGVYANGLLVESSSKRMMREYFH